MITAAILILWAGCWDELAGQLQVSTALTTWNRGALPQYPKPTPASYFGTCSAGASCQWDTDCAGGQSCTNGTCGGGSPCLRDSQCTTGQTCGNGTCSLSGATCRLDSQCPTGEKCRKFVDISFKSANTWFIDYGKNGYYKTAYPPPTSRWEYAYAGYGHDDAVPAPADYDGDGFTDLSVKDHSGYWYIDYSSNGFGGWDEVKEGYGDASALPVPGYYDSDARADLAVKSSSGFWAIDYASDGFGTWNIQVSLVHGWSYGDANSIPVPADYDGDGRTDISIKNQTTGTWSIDYAADGFGRLHPLTGLRTQWNVSVGNYGTATPIPADYNNDGMTDIAEKDADGTWMIDLAPTFGSWDQPFYSGYGATSIGVPADYNHDGLLDLSVVDAATGDWYVDFAATSAPIYGGWDNWPGLGQQAMRNNMRSLIDTFRPRVISTTVYDQSNTATSTLMVGERYTVDVVLEPGTMTTACTKEDAACPAWFGGVGGKCLRIGGQLTCVETASVEANPAVLASPSLTVHDGATFAPITTVQCPTDPANPTCRETPFCDVNTHICKPHRRFGIECSEPGSFVLGYQLRNGPAWKGQVDSHPVNPDYGIKIVCTASHTGLYGRVTERDPSARRTSNNQPGFYVRGIGIGGAQIKVRNSSGSIVGTATSAAIGDIGFWRIADLSGGPYTVQVTAPNHSDTIAVNVNVPVSGFELDTPLEEAFTPLRNTGARYTTYVDYSRNRTILHSIAVSSSSDAAIRLERAPERWGDCSGPLMTGPGPDPKQCQDPASPSLGNAQCPGFETLADAATRVGALAVMNAVWWDLCTGHSLGYMYNGSQMPAFPFCYGGTPRPPITSTTNCIDGPTYMAEGPPWNRPVLLAANKQPMLTAVGQSRQQFGIVETDANFLDTTSSWTRTSPKTAIWDPDHDGVSNVSYALQMSNPPLVFNNAVIAYGNFNPTVPGDYDYVFPRTTIGVKTDPLGSVLYLVIADGEGIHGGHGATANQMGHFFKDVLGAQNAFAIDSGLSTEMVIQGTRQATPRRINTLTGEDATIQTVPSLQFLDETPTVFGAVANFIRVVYTPQVIGPP